VPCSNDQATPAEHPSYWTSRNKPKNKGNVLLINIVTKNSRRALTGGPETVSLVGMQIVSDGYTLDSALAAGDALGDVLLDCGAG
jgi:hypothetical protein